MECYLSSSQSPGQTVGPLYKPPLPVIFTLLATDKGNNHACRSVKKRETRKKGGNETSHGAVDEINHKKGRRRLVKVVCKREGR